MQSAFEKIGVPDEIQVLIFVVSIALIVGAFFPGVDFGKIKVPNFGRVSRKILIFSGSLIFLAAAAARSPAFYIPEQGIFPASFTVQSQCSGFWMYRERQLCEDKNQPIPLIVTDGEICGWGVSYVTVHPTGYKTCRDISHGIERFENSQRVTKYRRNLSEQRPKDFVCEIMKNEFTRANPSLDIVWTDERSHEDIRLDPLRPGVKYSYDCSAIAHWKPIYLMNSSEACGPLDPVIQETKTPNQCPHPTEVAGYRQTQSVNCDWAEYYKVNAEITDSLFTQYVAGIAERPICTTCSEFSANAEQMAECLIRNFEIIHRLGLADVKSQEIVEEQIVNHMKILMESRRPIEAPKRKQMRNIITK